VNIRKKLALSFTVLLLLLMLVSGVSIMMMNGMGKEAKQIDEDWLPSIVVLGKMNKLTSDIPRYFLRYSVAVNEASKESFEKSIQAALNEMSEHRRVYEGLLESAEERKLYESFSKNWTSYETSLATMLNLVKQGDKQGAYRLVDEVTPVFQRASEALNEAVKSHTDGGNDAADRSVAAYQSGLLWILVLTFISLVAAIALTIKLSRSISKPMEDMVSLVSKVADGDLTEKATIQTKDETGQLGQSMNQMIERLHQLIGEVVSSSQSVASASEQISASTQEIASGSVTQSGSAQMMSELLRELSLAIDAVARTAEQAAELSEQTREHAETGGVVVRSSIQGMGHLNEQVSLLKQDSDKIGAIIDVIDDIADQTNLLALNAAIEAARAGDQGKGFSVVAEEVRKLAERSSDATKEISAIIRGMQLNMGKSLSAVQEAMGLSQKTGETFEAIVAHVNETAKQVTEIAAASEEQAAQSTEVLNAISSIAASSEEAASAAEQTAASSQELSTMAQRLLQAVSRFKLP
jgi:methyl-accepting chemotaxis protein